MPNEGRDVAVLSHPEGDVRATGGAALIAGITVWRQEVVSLLYSSEFRQAGHYLRWTLAGDYLRITCNNGPLPKSG